MASGSEPSSSSSAGTTPWVTLTPARVVVDHADRLGRRHDRVVHRVGAAHVEREQSGMRTFRDEVVRGTNLHGLRVHPVGLREGEDGRSDDLELRVGHERDGDVAARARLEHDLVVHGRGGHCLVHVGTSGLRDDHVADVVVGDVDDAVDGRQRVVGRVGRRRRRDVERDVSVVRLALVVEVLQRTHRDLLGRVPVRAREREGRRAADDLHLCVAGDVDQDVGGRLRRELDVDVLGGGAGLGDRERRGRDDERGGVVVGDRRVGVGDFGLKGSVDFGGGVVSSGASTTTVLVKLDAWGLFRWAAAPVHGLSASELRGAVIAFLMCNNCGYLGQNVTKYAP